MAKKNAPRKKTTSKKTASKKVAKKSSAKPGNKNLAALLSKIQVELASGKKRKFSARDISLAQDCFNRTGKVLISFKRSRIDGDAPGRTSTGSGTTIID
jgi:hypothetical protein